MIHWWRNGHTGTLDSSSWGHSMAPCQEPLTIQLLWVVLNCFFTTTFSTCSCEVIPLGMTTRSVFMDLPVIVTFMSGVTCPLNASECHPLALCSTPPTTNPSTQPWGLHLTTGTLCSCSLGTFLWFRITCGGNLLPSANTSNGTVTQVILLFTMSYHMWQKSNKLIL